MIGSLKKKKNPITLNRTRAGPVSGKLFKSDLCNEDYAVKIGDSITVTVPASVGRGVFYQSGTRLIGRKEALESIKEQLLKGQFTRSYR